MHRRSFACDAYELAPRSVGTWISGEAMKVTTAVDPMATDAMKPAVGLPLPQQGDVVTSGELEVEVCEAKQQQQNPGHVAKIITLTNGNAETYRDDRPGKAIVNGISKPLKVEPLPGDLIVSNVDHSTSKRLQDKTDSAANRTPRYFLTN